MSDIVERLRGKHSVPMFGGQGLPILGEAADEIERLRGHCNTLAYCLENTAKWMENGCDPAHAVAELRLNVKHLRATVQPSGIKASSSASR